MHFTWFSRCDGISPTSSMYIAQELRSGEGMIWSRVGENSISPGKPCEIRPVNEGAAGGGGGMPHFFFVYETLTLSNMLNV